MPEPNYSRRVVLVLVDSCDMAVAAAVRYARSQRPTVVRAVHFSMDSAQAARLRGQWLAAGNGVPLEIADCPDRRLAHAAAGMAALEAARPGTFVTVVLPRRGYPPLTGRVLHDRTADKIARVVSRVPNAVATIIPFDVRHHARQCAAVSGPDRREHELPVPAPGADPIGSLSQSRHATVQGRITDEQIRPVDHNNVLACRIADSTGDLTAVFYGRTHIAGLETGSRIRLRGVTSVGPDGCCTMINPCYELLR